MKTWLILAVLIAGYVGVTVWMSETPTRHERTDVLKDQEAPPAKKLDKATMAPGRVVELHTAKGEIDFVLFEKDCPKTTARIVELVEGGCYDGLSFNRVEKKLAKTELIQTDLCKKKVEPIPLEVMKGLINAKGAVGMARADDRNSGTSSFYILVEPWRHLDYGYTVFARLIRGMDVVMKIKKGDSITSAKIRPMAAEDRKLFNKVLTIQGLRETE